MQTCLDLGVQLANFSQASSVITKNATPQQSCLSQVAGSADSGLALLAFVQLDCFSQAMLEAQKQDQSSCTADVITASTLRIAA